MYELDALRAEVVGIPVLGEYGEAEVRVFERNGDEYRFRCKCHPGGTEIGGEGDYIEYMNRRYGPTYFAETVREAARGF